MNWNERLAKWADSLERTVEKVSDFGTAEVPEYINELIRWEIAYRGTLFLIGFVPLVILLVWSKTWMTSLYKKCEEFDKDTVIFPLIFYPLTCLLLFLICCVNFFPAMKAYVAPRLVIVDKIAELAKEYKK